MKNSSNRSLLVVGSVAFDEVDGPYGPQDQLLGGSASFIATAASYFTSACSIVAVVGDDFPEEHIEFFRSRGIDVSGLSREKGETFYWKGVYSNDLSSRETLVTKLGVFGDFKPVLSDKNKSPDLLFLGNIHPALQYSVLEQTSGTDLVAADTMNFWIDGERESLSKTLERVQTLIINDEEARQLAGEHNLVRAAAKIRSMGPNSLVIKRGDSGAMLFHDGGIFMAPALPLEEPKDPTGAGDSFAGGFMGYLAYAGSLEPDAIRAAMIYGSVMASFSVEQFSIDGLRNLSNKDIQGRFDAFYKLTQFDRIVI